MIFASAGHRAPFNRLMRVLDGWSRANPAVELFAQVGEGGYVPRHFRSTPLLDGDKREQVLNAATLLVSDTNIDLLITAIEREIPMIVMPRLSIFGEDVGSVQMALAQRVGSYPGLFTALGETELVDLLNGFRDNGTMAAAPAVPDRRQLIAAIVGEAAP